MRINILLLFLLAIILSCKSSSTTVGNYADNYIPYYLKVSEAKEMYFSQQYDRSFSILDSLFAKYRPINTMFVDELEMYCELSLKNGKTERLTEVVNILVNDYGYDLASNNDSLWRAVKNTIHLSDNKLKRQHLKYVANLDLVLRDSLINIFANDQMIRKTNDKKKIDSVDRLNEVFHVKFLKKKGYPTAKLFGGNCRNDPYNPAFMSVMLKHISLKGVLEIQPRLLEDVRRGKCPPSIYAGMLDVRKIVAKETTPYAYYGTIKNVPPRDTLETNKARAAIGLAKLKS